MGKIKLADHFGEPTSRLVTALLKETAGDPAIQVSMYDLSERIGLVSSAGITEKLYAIKQLPA